MKKALAIGTILALVTIAFAAMPMKVSAVATVVKIEPKRGKVGQQVFILGYHYTDPVRPSVPTVKFQSSTASDAKVLNDKVIKATVPDRNMLDPNPVKVKITLDGEPVEGDIEFLYDPPGPEPTISNVNPPSAPVGTEFTLEITGTYFMTPHGRLPNQVILVGPETVWGGIIPGSVTDTSFIAEFPPVPTGSIYLLYIGFSDGAGVDAEYSVE